MMGKREIIDLKRNCPGCGKVNDISVNVGNYNWFISGESIHNAFGYLSEEDREMILTGYCKNCQRKIFAKENEAE